MSVKISKKVLKGLIGKLLSEQEQEINFTKGMTIKPEGAKSNLPPEVLAAIEELKRALQAPELSAKVQSAIESLSATPTSLPENAAANALKKAVKHQARVSSDLEKLSEVEEELEEGSCSTGAANLRTLPLLYFNLYSPCAPSEGNKMEPRYLIKNNDTSIHANQNIPERFNFL